MKNYKEMFDEAIKEAIDQIYLSSQNTVDYSKKDTKVRAKAFATTIYLDDIIAALASTFTLGTDFKKKLKNIMAKYEWYADQFNPGLFLDDDELEEEKIILSGEEYYLAGWEDTKKGFLFELKKIYPDKRIETVEFLLTVPENN